jgi:hypothetical protein
VSGRTPAFFVAALALTLLGCDEGGDDALDHAARDDRGPRGPGLDLGLAAYPPATPAARAVTHAWLARTLRPSAYRLEYALGTTEAGSVNHDLASYAEKVDYHEGANGTFHWVAPQGCVGDMHCIYEAVAARSRADIRPVAERFRARARAAKLSALETAQLVVTFVQAVPYEVPKEPFGLLPPALVLSRRKGDCDSKALVAHMILHDLGIETVMVASAAHHHEMLGIALPAEGVGFTHAGRRYAFTELTSKGWPIGHMDPRLRKPYDWRVVPVRLDR